MTECSTIDRLRKPKLYGMAIFDWLASLLGAYIVGEYALKLHNLEQWIVFVIVWIVIGILAHVLSGTPTMFNYYLGLSEKPIRKQCD